MSRPSNRPSWANKNELLRNYYDLEWGRPVRSEIGVFERISLEIFQSGLSWETILKKRPAFRSSFAQFHPEKVAEFTETEVAFLLANPAIIRNERKIRTTINNAQATLDLRKMGGLVELVWSFAPLDKPIFRREEDIPVATEYSQALAKELKNYGFKGVGPTNMFALLTAIGVVDARLV